MSTATYELARLQSRLEHYETAMSELLSLLDGRMPLRGGDKEEAQDRLRDLKRDLNADVKQHDYSPPFASGSEMMFQSAIRQAAATINVACNTIPNQRWYSELSSAKIDIRYALDVLRRSSP